MLGSWGVNIGWKKRGGSLISDKIVFKITNDAKQKQHIPFTFITTPKAGVHKTMSTSHTPHSVKGNVSRKSLAGGGRSW